MKVRYYKLFDLMREKKVTLATLRLYLGLLPTEIAKIETNRLIDCTTLFLICKYFNCDTGDIMDIFLEDDPDVFYNKRILTKHSYIPKPRP